MAEIDSCPSDNFVSYDILTDVERKSLQPNPSSVPLAANGSTMRFRGRLPFATRLGERSYPGMFYAGHQMRTNIILGRTWLKQHDVNRKHRTDCLYLGNNERQWIYLVPMPSFLGSNTPPTQFDFPTEMRADVQRRMRDTLQLHGTVFHRRGQLRQTPAIEHDIQL